VTSIVRALRALGATWRGRFILAFLVVQLLLPLHYYTVRRDPHDERWAWRMFSPMRMAKCRARFVLDNQPVSLGTKFHEAWVSTAERGRMSVIEAMAARLCRENPGKPVEVTVDCQYMDRPPATYGGFDACTRPLL
jgi:hypothetical protein